MDYKLHIVQSQVQSTDSILLSRRFTIKQAKNSNMVAPNDGEDSDIELSTTFLGFASAQLR